MIKYIVLSVIIFALTVMCTYDVLDPVCGLVGGALCLGWIGALVSIDEENQHRKSKSASTDTSSKRKTL